MKLNSQNYSMHLREKMFWVLLFKQKFNYRNYKTEISQIRHLNVKTLITTKKEMKYLCF